MNMKKHSLPWKPVIIGILFFHFFIVNLVSASPDVLHLCEDMVINGKLLNIVFRQEEKQILEYVIIDSEIGTLKIDGNSILNYWITSNPDEDISIYKQLGKNLSQETYKKIKDNYDYSSQLKVDIIKAENPSEEQEVIALEEGEDFSPGKKTEYAGTANEENEITEKTEISSVQEQLEGDKEKTIASEKHLKSSGLMPGFGLTVGGSSLLLAGASILVYDLAFYSNEVRNILDTDLRTDKLYEQYNTSYTIFMTLLVGGGVSFVSGAVLLVLGIPDLLKENEKQELKPQIMITAHSTEVIRFQISIKI